MDKPAPRRNLRSKHGCLDGWFFKSSITEFVPARVQASVPSFDLRLFSPNSRALARERRVYGIFWRGLHLRSRTPSPIFAWVVSRPSHTRSPGHNGKTTRGRRCDLSTSGSSFSVRPPYKGDASSAVAQATTILLRASPACAGSLTSSELSPPKQLCTSPATGATAARLWAHRHRVSFSPNPSAGDRRAAKRLPVREVPQLPGRFDKG